MAIKIDAVSDLHGTYPELAGGDLLIVAGDLTARDHVYQYARFFRWLAQQQYRKKVVIAGNHDGYFTRVDPKKAATELVGMGADKFEYLQDSGCEFEGYKIWGSPWTPIFFNWHFMLGQKDIAEKWALIPEDTDILVTHGPAYGTLDKVSPGRKDRCGCRELKKRIELLPKLKYHIFGHIHGSYGQKVTYPELKTPCPHSEGQTFYRYTSVNCAHMDEDYEPVNAPISIKL